ncbi:hypothetical protein BDV95DRAFT_596491 [Massariosphaeria phaeospora]|uniref:Uncharacterized protein n=1 Tax=Massariosphaeria phaeospora TaxID=100035 RepID=A0A7C8M3V3_9PLEO|nr:hypothetical protein BDV95DRAFT_596491 [Massariosphaeria phaeospora]
MDQTREMRSDSLRDAEEDADSSLGETPWPETDARETQAVDVLCNIKASDGSPASRHASIEPCLLEQPAALTASQTEATVDLAMDQAVTSTSEPEVFELSPTEAAMTFTSDQKPDPRTTPPPKSPRVDSARDPGGAMNVQEDDTQPVTRNHHLSIGSSAIDEQTRANSEPIADDQDDSHVASASPSECRANTETTSPVLHTASHGQDASSRSVTHGSIDLSEEELSESIIIDTNRGEPIVIDSSDEKMHDDNSRPKPRRRAQRRRVPPQSPEMVNWTSKEFETRSAASVTAAWEEV